MAKRYSGQLIVDIAWHDSKQEYRASVSYPGGHKTVCVGPPGVLTKAVDSSIAYDEAAAAAISFASEDDPEIGELADHTDKGLFIGRKPPGASGRRH